jgi:magnesium chelatase family protein
MGAAIHGLIDLDIKGLVVDVECHLTNNLSNIVIVGIANKALDEAKERIRGAFNSRKFTLPRKRITLNFSPADIPKDGSSFDLPMAVAILLETGQIKFSNSLSTSILFGELELDGSIRPIRGIIGKILNAKKSGYRKFIIPLNNLEQAELVPEIDNLPIANLQRGIDN